MTHLHNTRVALPELLAPAGNPDRLRTALLYGADAVYLGGKDKLNLRAGALGFSWAELDLAVAAASTQGAKIYYCLNVLPDERDFSRAEQSLERLAESGVSGLIIADPGLLGLALELAPHLPVHLSTQANTCNARSAAFWARAGVSRVNLARELNRDRLAELLDALERLAPELETEIFVHGAMCLAVSGQCLMSAWLNDRPGNLGQCTHPCRFLYRPKRVELEEELRPGQVTFELRNTSEDFCGVFSPEDMCLVTYLPWLVERGFSALKLEGRMRTAGLMGQTVNVYRTALDDIARGAFRPDLYLRELAGLAARPLGTGFFLPDGQREILAEPLPETDVGGKVAAHLEGAAEAGGARISVREIWDVSRPAQILLPGLQTIELAPGSYALENQRGEKTDRLHPGIIGVLHADIPNLQPGTLIRVC